MLIFRVFLAFLVISGRFRFDLGELDTLKGEKSLIIAPNHPCLLDAVLIISRLPNVACIMKADIIGNVFLGGGARLAGYIRNDAQRRMIMQAVEDLQRGSHLLLFPEGTRTARGPISPLKGSIGVIARPCQGAGANRIHRDRFALSQQGLAGLQNAAACRSPIASAWAAASTRRKKCGIHDRDWSTTLPSCAARFRAFPAARRTRSAVETFRQCLPIIR